MGICLPPHAYLCFILTDKHRSRQSLIVTAGFFVVQIHHTPQKGAVMTLSWPEILIILLVIGFIVAFSYRAGIVRGRHTRRPKE
jgi:hypothetical protein